MPEVLKSPRAAILKVAGTNCDAETRYGFETAGARAEVVHMNQLKTGEAKLDDYQIVVIPGGFSYGDDIASGRVWAVELQTRLADELLEHTRHRGRLVMGICNGFQVLVQTGLLPFGELSTLDQTRATLGPNASGRFESRWIRLKPEESRFVFGLKNDPVLSLPVAHGEGRFIATPANLARIEKQGLVVFRYCDAQGEPSQVYPDNPNGSANAIAGLTDPGGRIVGLMPHPERYIDRYQHPNWRRLPKDFAPDGLKIIQSIVSYARQL